MASIDSISLPSSVSYFDPQVYETATKKEYNREFNPLAALKPDQPIEFFVRGADSLYVDLSNSMIAIGVKVSNDDDSSLASNASVGPVNNVLHTLFAEAHLELNGQSVNDTNTLYPYRAAMDTILNFSQDVTKTRLLAEGWYADTPGKFDINDITGANEGLKERAKWCKESKVMHLMGRPHVDLFSCDKDIPPNIDIKLRLIPNKPQFNLMATSDSAKYKYSIAYAKFVVRTKEMSPDVILATQSILMKKPVNMRIDYGRIRMNTHSIASGVTNFEIDNLFQGVLPDKIVIGFVRNASMGGTFTSNPLNFENFDLSELYITVNGEQHPRVPLRLNFKSGDYIRAYMHMLSALGLDNKDHCIDLTPEQWANGNTLFPFKISPGEICSGARSVPITGNIKVAGKFATDLPANVNMVAFAQYNSSIHIDKFGNVTAT